MKGNWNFGSNGYIRESYRLIDTINTYKISFH